MKSQSKSNSRKQSKNHNNMNININNKNPVQKPTQIIDKHYRSFSNNENSNKLKKQYYSSYLYQNAKNSLCAGSPRVDNNMIIIKDGHMNSSNQNNNNTNTYNMNNNTKQKYRSYMQFMQSGKITPDSYSNKNSFIFYNKKNKTITPTPRRNSLQYQTQRKRLSILKDININVNGRSSVCGGKIYTNSKDKCKDKGKQMEKDHDKQKNYVHKSIQKQKQRQRQKQKGNNKKSHIKNQFSIKGKVLTCNGNNNSSKIDKDKDKQKQKDKQKNKNMQNKKNNNKQKNKIHKINININTNDQKLNSIINQQQTSGRRTIQSRKSSQQNQKKQKNQSSQQKNSHHINASTLAKNMQRPLSVAEQKLQQDQTLLLSHLFKGIEFHRDLGKGAHALVKSAVDWNNNRKIAIKIYNRLSISPQQLKNIQRQVQILTRLSHQNIVKLYQIMQSYKTINLIMQYGGGNSLEQFIRSKVEGRLGEDQARVIFVQVLKAVQYLERMNIVHRDLKTQNILLNKYLSVKLIDFGFSLKCQQNCEIVEYCGTPTYMAPEVVSKARHNPHLADRWSLGVLLYTMLNGVCPFKATQQKQLFQKIIKGQYVYLINISNEAKYLIDSFLLRDPILRMSAADALKSDWVIKNQQNQREQDQNINNQKCS